MYSTEETTEQLKSIQLLGGEQWINLRAENPADIRQWIKNKESLSLDDLTGMVEVTEDQVVQLEDIDLNLINNKISEKEALTKRAKLQKDLIEVLAVYSKTSKSFTIAQARGMDGKEFK